VDGFEDVNGFAAKKYFKTHTLIIKISSQYYSRKRVNDEKETHDVCGKLSIDENFSQSSRNTE